MYNGSLGSPFPFPFSLSLFSLFLFSMFHVPFSFPLVSFLFPPPFYFSLSFSPSFPFPLPSLFVSLSLSLSPFPPQPTSPRSSPSARFPPARSRQGAPPARRGGGGSSVPGREGEDKEGERGPLNRCCSAAELGREKTVPRGAWGGEPGVAAIPRGEPSSGHPGLGAGGLGQPARLSPARFGPDGPGAAPGFWGRGMKRGVRAAGPLWWRERGVPRLPSLPWCFSGAGVPLC